MTLARAGYAQLLASMTSAGIKYVAYKLYDNAEIDVSDHPEKEHIIHSFGYRGVVNQSLYKGILTSVQKQTDKNTSVDEYVADIHDKMDQYDFEGCDRIIERAIKISNDVKMNIKMGDVDPTNLFCPGEKGKTRSTVHSVSEWLGSVFDSMKFAEVAEKKPNNLLVENCNPEYNGNKVHTSNYAYFAPFGEVGDGYSNPNAWTKLEIYRKKLIDFGPRAKMNYEEYVDHEFDEVCDYLKADRPFFFEYNNGEDECIIYPAKLTGMTQISDLMSASVPRVSVLSLDMIEGALESDVNNGVFLKYSFFLICPLSALCVAIPCGMVQFSDELRGFLNARKPGIFKGAALVTSNNVKLYASACTKLCVAALPLLKILGSDAEKFATCKHFFVRAIKQWIENNPGISPQLHTIFRVFLIRNADHLDVHLQHVVSKDVQFSEFLTSRKIDIPDYNPDVNGDDQELEKLRNIMIAKKVERERHRASLLADAIDKDSVVETSVSKAALVENTINEFLGTH
jgi:hypothetical protein